MASLSKQLMDEFNDWAKLYKSEGDFGRGLVFDSCEGMVNNFLHGRPFSEVAPLVRAALDGNAHLERLDQEERDAYAEAVQILDEFVKAHAS